MPFLESKFDEFVTRERVIAGEDWRPMTDRGLIRAGISDTALGYGYEHRNRDYGLILATLSGVGSVLVNGEWRSIKPHMAYLAPANTTNAYKAIEVSRWEFAWVVYDAQRARTIIKNPSPAIISADFELFRLALEGLYYIDLNGLGSQLVDTWAETVHQCALRIAVGSDVNTLARLWSEVDRNLAYRWTLRDLCKATNMSDESLRTFSLRETGRSPMRQLTHLRMRRAGFLLRTTRLTLEQIAQQVGYQNAFTFSVSFKSWAGVPPSHYRSARLPSGEFGNDAGSKN